MLKNNKSGLLTSYPHLWEWVRNFGTVEIGHCGQTGSFIRVLDEGGIVWKGHRTYRTLDGALALIGEAPGRCLPCLPRVRKRGGFIGNPPPQLN